MITQMIHGPRYEKRIMAPRGNPRQPRAATTARAARFLWRATMGLMALTFLLSLYLPSRIANDSNSSMESCSLGWETDPRPILERVGQRRANNGPRGNEGARILAYLGRQAQEPLASGEATSTATSLTPEGPGSGATLAAPASNEGNTIFPHIGVAATAASPDTPYGGPNLQKGAQRHSAANCPIRCAESSIPKSEGSSMAAPSIPPPTGGKVNFQFRSGNPRVVTTGVPDPHKVPIEEKKAEKEGVPIPKPGNKREREASPESPAAKRGVPASEEHAERFAFELAAVERAFGIPVGYSVSAPVFQRMCSAFASAPASPTALGAWEFGALADDNAPASASQQFGAPFGEYVFPDTQEEDLSIEDDPSNEDADKAGSSNGDKPQA